MMVVVLMRLASTGRSRGSRSGRILPHLPWVQAVLAAAALSLRLLLLRVPG
jgi:hypothetical protein